MGFTREELERFRDATVPDLVGPGVRLLFVGINPGLWTAATGAHFAHPGNRFYPALAGAGLVEWRIDATAGMRPEDRDHLLARGIGISNLVPRATARASELTRDELRGGDERLRQDLRAWRPAVVAVAGITAYRTAFGVTKAQVGRQPQELEGAQLWVVPNPSGLNAHETIATLADHYRAAGRAAGLSPAVE